MTLNRHHVKPWMISQNSQEMKETPPNKRIQTSGNGQELNLSGVNSASEFSELTGCFPLAICRAISVRPSWAVKREKRDTLKRQAVLNVMRTSVKVDYLAGSAANWIAIAISGYNTSVFEQNNIANRLARAGQLDWLRLHGSSQFDCRQPRISPITRVMEAIKLSRLKSQLGLSSISTKSQPWYIRAQHHSLCDVAEVYNMHILMNLAGQKNQNLGVWNSFSVIKVPVKWKQMPCKLDTSQRIVLLNLTNLND